MILLGRRLEATMCSGPPIKVPGQAIILPELSKQRVACQASNTFPLVEVKGMLSFLYLG
jgi:hypothetical protein